MEKRTFFTFSRRPLSGRKKKKGVEDRAVFGLIRLSDQRLIIVQDAAKKMPNGQFLWKFPGGRNKPADGHNPRHTLIRELNEELPLADNQWRVRSVAERPLYCVHHMEKGYSLQFLIVEPDQSFQPSQISNGPEIRAHRLATPQDIRSLISSSQFAFEHGLAFTILDGFYY